jgi:hypothetical protein
MSVRTRGAGHYEIVLILIVAVVALTPLDTTVIRPLIVALLGLLIAFSFWTSGSPNSALIMASVFATLAWISAAAGQVAEGKVPRAISTAVSVVLCAGAIAAIVRNLAAQTRVTRRTVTGALAVYLLLGLLFAYAFGLIGVVNSQGFFAQHGDHPPVDYVYFSYVSLTTVGYGDLTAGTSLGRILAVMEALTGQLYLVTIVAVVVGNIGRDRAGPRGKP